jgi:predicted MFS family arabinose efflux permease
MADSDATVGGRTSLHRSGRIYALLLLTALSAVNQLDRQLINILIEPIRLEFGLGDFQLGLLSGFSFVVLYGLLSVPAAHYAVRIGSRNMLSAAALIWGGMTLASGFAQSYVHLLLARIGVGFGEAGGMPPSHAMISNLYGPAERGGAMATWSSGVNVGIFLSFLGGGYIGNHYGWRAAFVVAGLLTIALAVVLRISIREPRRLSADAPRERRRGLVLATAKVMWRDSVLRQIWIAGTLAAITGYASLAWVPAYLVRTHGLNIAQVGLYFALVAGLGGALGTFLGGVISDRVRARDVRWSVWLVGVCLAICKPVVIFFLLTDDTAVALTLFIAPAMIASIYLGPSLALLHNRVETVDVDMRPMASALYLLTLNVVGFGLGPVLVGAMSQWVFHASGGGSLRYALVAMQIGGLVATLHFFIAGARLRSA